MLPAHAAVGVQESRQKRQEEALGLGNDPSRNTQRGALVADLMVDQLGGTTRAEACNRVIQTGVAFAPDRLCAATTCACAPANVLKKGRVALDDFPLGCADLEDQPPSERLSAQRPAPTAGLYENFFS